MSNIELYRQLKAASDGLITDNMPLVTYKLESFLAENPTAEFLRDDLYGEGNLALVRAVRMLLEVELETDDPTAYIATSIYHAFRDAANGAAFGPSNRTVRDGGAELPEQVPLDDIPEPYDDGEGEPYLDVYEEILACCEDDTDREIVRLRAEELTQAEVAERVALDTANVCRRLAAIYARYEARRNDY